MSLPQGVHQSHILLRTIPLWSQVLPAPTEQMVLLGYVTCWRLVTTTNLPAPPQRWDLSGVMGGIVTKILCLAEPVVGLLNFLLDPSMHFLVKSSPSKSDGEGNGTQLQYSCLENPRDGRAWWVAVYRVTQSRTRLKWLSSSSTVTAYAKTWRFQRNWHNGGAERSSIIIKTGIYSAHLHLWYSTVLALRANTVLQSGTTWNWQCILTLALWQRFQICFISIS